MVATHILLAQRAEALERLRDTLAGLDGADAERVLETAERAGGGRVGPEYAQALYLAEIAQVLDDQQARIEALENQASGAAKRKK